MTPEEFEAFKQLDDYPSYAKLSDKAKRFKAPEFDEKSSLEHINSKLSSKSKFIKSNLFKYAGAIAAIFIISFLVYKTLGLDTSTVSISTQTAKNQNIKLPDQSSVSLNANSQLKFETKDWEDNRQLFLNGEAFFEG